MVSRRSEKLREHRGRGLLNQVGRCQTAQAPDGAKMRPFVVGMQLATREAEANRGRLVMSGKMSRFLFLMQGKLWKWERGAGMRSLHLHLKRLSWTPMLGTVQGQGSIWCN